MATAGVCELCSLLAIFALDELCHENTCLSYDANLLPSSDSRRVVVSYKRKYVHEVLVNHLVKLAQKKSVVR